MVLLVRILLLMEEESFSCSSSLIQNNNTLLATKRFQEGVAKTSRQIEASLRPREFENIPAAQRSTNREGSAHFMIRARRFLGKTGEVECALEKIQRILFSVKNLPISCRNMVT